MRIEQALDFLHASNAAQFESLSDLIPNELITTLLAEEDVVTLRRRRMPMYYRSEGSGVIPAV